jgi:hypothetical protein
MAHFAQLDDTNTVTQVIVVNNSELLNESGNESEQKGIDFCKSLFGGNWIQTSYNGNIRKNFASIGYLYDPVKDAFIPLRPFLSWVLDEDTCIWKAPIPRPDASIFWVWDEENIQWIELPPLTQK